MKKKRKKKNNSTKARNNPLKTRIPKSLSWIEKYLRRVMHRMPTMPMPRAIRAFRPNLKKRHLTLGSCCRSDKTINLATHTLEEVIVKGKKKRVLVPLSHLEILQTLAHELSHLVYDPHGYEQEWYGRTIFHTFGIMECCPHCSGKGRVPARYVNE